MDSKPAADAATIPAAPAMTKTGETFSPILNAHLQAIDKTLSESNLRPEDQAGVAIMAVVLTIRRLMDHHKIHDRGRRRLTIKAAVAEFERKCRRYVAEPGVVLTVQDPPSETIGDVPPAPYSRDDVTS